MTITRRGFLGTSLALAALPRSTWIGRATTSADTPQRWLARWIEAFNGTLDSNYAAFVHEHIPALVPYLDDDLGVRESSGGFLLLRSEETAPREITAWVRDRNWDRFSRVVLTIGDGRIDDLAFLGAPTPADFSVPRLSERDALDTLRAKLRTEAAGRRIAGAVLVARGNEILFREAYGDRRIVLADAAAPETRYCIGSMGKMFTAIAVLQLVQAARLRLSDTIAALLPAYPSTSLARQVTVAQLLTHSGGTGDFFGADYDAHQAELRVPADFVRRFGQREAAFEPGSRWGYSNFGFVLLGAIVEQVAGMSWDAYQESHIFRVAGMTATSPLATAADTAEPSTGSAQTGRKALPYYVGLPAGGGYSTVDDLHRLGVALRDARLLDATHLDLLTRARIATGSGHWSLGLRVAVRNGASCFGHGGSAPGANADFAEYPASGYRTIVLCNRGHPQAVNVAEFIGARLPLGSAQ